MRWNTIFIRLDVIVIRDRCWQSTELTLCMFLVSMHLLIWYYNRFVSFPSHLQNKKKIILNKGRFKLNYTYNSYYGKTNYSFPCLQWQKSIVRCLVTWCLLSRYGYSYLSGDSHLVIVLFIASCGKFCRGQALSDTTVDKKISDWDGFRGNVQFCKQLSFIFGRIIWIKVLSEDMLLELLHLTQ